MTPRLDPYSVSPKEMQELISFHEFRELSGIDENLVELLRVRVSQINACTSGVRRHMRRARNLGETDERLESLNVWRETTLYTERECAAFEWTEAATLPYHHTTTERAFENISQWFTDSEVVKLTTVAAATSAWNRVERCFSRDLPATIDHVSK